MKNHLQKCSEPTMKIGILTYFGARNYGAFLQAYALREVVKNSTDSNVELINYRTLKEVQAYSVQKIPLFKRRHYIRVLPELRYYRQQNKTFEKSTRKYQTLSKESLISDSVEKFAAFVNGRYDLIIAGSDEIWKTDGFRLFPNAYWLPNVRSKKIAIAVSSRNTIDSLNDSQKAWIRAFTESFDYIGTRDKATYELISGLTTEPRKCHLNCDPTFLYDFPADREKGKRILQKKFGVKSSRKVIGLILSDRQYGRTIADSLKETFEVVSLSSYIEEAKNYASLPPFDWIAVIAACDMIISSRFHGVVFSIKTNKPFLAIEMDNCRKETSKLYDLLERNNLTRFYVEYRENASQVLSHRIPEFIQSAEQKSHPIDYSAVIKSEKKLAARPPFFLGSV